MNPAIADMKAKWATMPYEHSTYATYAVFEDGVYRLYTLTIGRVEYFVQARWEQEAGHPVRPVEW